MSESRTEQAAPPKDLGYTTLYTCSKCGKKKRGGGPGILPIGWKWRDGHLYVCGGCA